MKKFLSLIFVILFLCQCTNYKEEAKIRGIVPRPAYTRVHEGSFLINEQTQILFQDDQKAIQSTATYFSDFFSKATGINLPVVPMSSVKSMDNTILLTTQNAPKKLGPEGYILDVKPGTVYIQAPSAAGIFYGLQSIRQLLPVTIEQSAPKNQTTKWEIPALYIKDQPRFKWRGMHLDVSRHFFPKAFIKKYIDLLALHKMNVFHWHLTDDNGWRLEIKKYPKLTEIAAWHVDRSDQPWIGSEPPKKGEKATVGGFYTQEDVREILTYAKQRHITVIPEIEMPGHTSEIFSAYPEYSCRGIQLPVQPASYWPNTDIFCAGKEETFTFIQNILDEVMELFPAPYIHIGGDEADKTQWKKCKACQRRIRKEGLKDEAELQSYFIKRIENYLIAHNKQLIGWDEILEGGLAPEATVMSWRGMDGGIKAAQEGHDVIMTPTSHCYFDYYQADPDFEPKAIGGFTTLKKVYSFDPIPPVLNDAEAQHILGAQANLWTEYVPTTEHAEYMTLPRMSALAEVVWTKKSRQDWPHFQARMNRLYPRFDAMQLNYSKGSYRVHFVPAYDSIQHQYSIKLESEQLNADIHYTTSGDEPSLQSPTYRDPLIIQSTSTIKAAIFEDGQLKEKPSNLSLTVHAGIGKTIEYLTTPSYKYQGSGNSTLVDGLKGSTSLNDGRWQGFDGKNIEVVIDLGKLMPLQKIQAGFIQNQKSWVFLPTTVEVQLSADGKSFTPAEQISHTIPLQQSGNIQHDFVLSFPANTETQYVKIMANNIQKCPEWHPAKGEKSWIFCDEICIN